MSAEPFPCLRPDWPAPERVNVLQTLRAGGTSRAPWDSLNLGLHVGDDPARVRANRARVGELLGSTTGPLWLRQMHGTRVIDADAADPDEIHEADGATTVVDDRAIAVLTADCLPVVIASAERISVVHAGWRGLAAGIVREALRAFDASQPVHVWLGPAIGPRAFEVGEEVREAFVADDPRRVNAFRPAGAPGKYFADLYALARAEVAASGHEDAEIGGGNRCTFTEPDAFYSHRRDGPRTGRMATVAWLSAP